MRQILFLALCVASSVVAQDGQLDQSFANSGYAFFDPSVVSEQPTCVHVKDDGRILGGGNQYEGVNTECWIIQCLPDGAPDPDFGFNGRSLVNFCTSRDRLTMLLSQPDGKVIAAGYESFNNDINDQGIVFRLNADGELDTEWGLDGLAYVTAEHDVELPAIALQPDGRVLAAGYYSEGSLQDGVVRRFLQDGTLDPSFGGNGQVLIEAAGNDWINNVLVCADGGILVGGTETSTPVAYRFLGDGTPHMDFGVNGKLTGSFSAGGNFIGGYTFIAMDDEERILFYGLTTGATAHIGIKAYLADGTPDLDYGTNSEVSYDLGGAGINASRGRLLADGRLVIPLSGQAFGTFNMICFNTDGTLTGTFGTNGIASANLGGDFRAMAADIQGDSALVVLGAESITPGSSPIMVRYNLDDVSTGIPTAEAAAYTRIYPVPTLGQDVTVLPGCALLDGTLVVRDAMGRTVAVEPQAIGERVLLRGSSTLPSGFYAVTMRTRCGARTVPFMVR